MRLIIPEGENDCYPDKAFEKFVRVSNNDDGMKRMEDTDTILECKFDDRMPHWMVKMVRRLGVMAESVSKYCLSIEAWKGFPG